MAEYFYIIVHYSVQVVKQHLTYIDVSSEQALKWCSDADAWSEFGARVLEAAEKVDLSYLSNSHISAIEEVNESIDWR